MLRVCMRHEANTCLPESRGHPMLRATCQKANWPAHKKWCDYLSHETNARCSPCLGIGSGAMAGALTSFQVNFLNVLQGGVASLLIFTKKRLCQLVLPLVAARLFGASRDQVGELVGNPKKQLLEFAWILFARSASNAVQIVIVHQEAEST